MQLVYIYLIVYITYDAFGFKTIICMKCKVRSRRHRNNELVTIAIEEVPQEG